MNRHQFAAMNMIYQRYSFRYFLESMQRLGIQKFELWTGAPHLNCLVSSLSDTRSTKNMIDSYGLTATCLTPEQVVYPYNIAASNEELRKLSIDYFCRYIEMAAEMKIPKMLCASGWGDYDEPKEQAWKRSFDSLEILLKKAEACHVVLAFEILQDFESNLCNDLSSTQRVMEHFDSPFFSLCVDTVPMRRTQKNVVDFFNIFGKRICHFHLTDGTPSGHMPTGTGDAPLYDYLDELGALGYSGDITLEIGDTSWADRPEEATKISFDTIDRYLSEH